jgi:hypothetical protein
LGSKGGGESLWCCDESGAEGIADSLEDVAAVCFDSFLQKGIMAGKGSLHRVGVSFPQLGAPLDVGEEESNRSSRQNPIFGILHFEIFHLEIFLFGI